MENHRIKSFNGADTAREVPPCARTRPREMEYDFGVNPFTETIILFENSLKITGVLESYVRDEIVSSTTRPIKTRFGGNHIHRV